MFTYLLTYIDVSLTNVVSFCQDAYENEMENMEQHVTALFGEEHARLYPLITKLVIASCQMVKH